MSILNDLSPANEANFVAELNATATKKTGTVDAMIFNRIEKAIKKGFRTCVVILPDSAFQELDDASVILKKKGYELIVLSSNRYIFVTISWA